MMGTTDREDRNTDPGLWKTSYENPNPWTEVWWKTLYKTDYSLDDSQVNSWEISGGQKTETIESFMRKNTN